MCINLCPSPPGLPLGTTSGQTRVWLPLHHSLLSGIHGSDHPDPPLLQTEHSQFSHPLLIGEMIQSISYFHGPLLDSLHVFVVLVSPELDHSQNC